MQEAYRATSNRESRFQHYAEKLNDIYDKHPDRWKASRTLQRGVRQIELKASEWNQLPQSRHSHIEPRNAVRLFYCYSHKDEHLRDELEKHLSIMQRQSAISQWHDRRIGAGEDWKGEIDVHLQEADIVLPLISADFLSSDYCYDVEMDLALQRSQKGQLTIIPVFLRECDWRGSRFANLQGCPTDAKSVTSWSNHDEAFTNVAQFIRDAVEKIRLVRSLEKFRLMGIKKRRPLPLRLHHQSTSKEGQDS